jgi:Gram-negative bacterial TonB protein C-terminal
VAAPSGSVQLLDSQQSKAAAPFRWFSPAEQPLDSGEIDSHHALLAIVHRIYSQHLTGKLQLVFGRVEKALFFDAGALVFATSSDRQDGLGEVMLRAGALTQSQFEEASTLVETGQRFGSAIAEMGIYGVEQIISWVQRQVLQITASVLDYPAGRYFFFSSPEKNVVPEIGGIPVPLGRLLLAAVRKAGDLPLDQLAEDSTLQVELSSDAPRLSKAKDLEDGERHLLSLISQHISVKHIVAQSGLPRPEASRALYALLLSGFVVGVRDDVRPKTEPVVPTPPAEPEQPRAVEASSATKIPEQRSVDDSVPVEEATPKASEVSSAGEIEHAQPHVEQTAADPEEPIGTEPLPTTPLPLLKPNATSREVPVRAIGISPEKNEPGRHLFTEETASVLVAETGGVIRLSAAVTAGQLLVLANVETKREVIVQILRKRSYKPTMCYLELEFVEAAPRFWGTEFSAATALLPKNTKDVETAALVITAESTADQPWVLPTAPDASELQTFKREMEELRGKPALTETLPTNSEASALAQLRGEVYPASAIPGPNDALSTEAILESGLEAAAAVAPTKRVADPARSEAAEHMETPQTVSDFINSLPKSKRWRLPRGGSTPEFNRAVLILAILLVGLVAGTAWYKNWLPWKWAGTKLKKPAASDNMRVASDAPVTSAGMPAKSAPVPDAGATAPAAVSAAPVEAASSGAPVEPLASKKKASRAVTAAKASSVRPAAKPAANSEANSGKDSAVIPPKLIQSVQAVASLEAMRDFERGNVVIDAVVGTSGEVHFISVISGPPSLRAPAVESLKEYKYEPATRNGQPVPAHVTITIHFRFEP